MEKKGTGKAAAVIIGVSALGSLGYLAYKWLYDKPRVGRKLQFRFKFSYKGPAQKVWTGATLALYPHLKLGSFPVAGGWQDVEETGRADKIYMTPWYKILITEAMRAETMDCLRIVAREPIKDDISNLSRARYDDDWDSKVLVVEE